MSDKATLWAMVLCSWAAVAFLVFAIGIAPWLWIRWVLYAVLLLFVAAAFAVTRVLRKARKLWEDMDNEW